MKFAISSQYEVYLQDFKFNHELDQDPTSFSQAINEENYKLWHDVVMEGMKSMAKNKVRDIVQLPFGHSTIGFKWIYKTKRNASSKIEWYKARLVAKEFTKKEGIDY